MYIKPKTYSITYSHKDQRSVNEFSDTNFQASPLSQFRFNIFQVPQRRGSTPSMGSSDKARKLHPVEAQLPMLVPFRSEMLRPDWPVSPSPGLGSANDVQPPSSSHQGTYSCSNH